MINGPAAIGALAFSKRTFGHWIFGVWTACDVSERAAVFGINVVAAANVKRQKGAPERSCWWPSGIAAGRPLSVDEQAHVVAALARWLGAQLCTSRFIHSSKTVGNSSGRGSSAYCPVPKTPGK